MRGKNVAIVTAVSLAFIFTNAIGHTPERLDARKPGPAPLSASSDERFVKVRQVISSGLEARNVPSVSIAAAQKGRVIWEESFGWADREKHIKASPETVYSLASTTKPMTATSLLVLVKQGTVDLDVPVEGYIGTDQLTVYEGSAKDVSLRQLLHHRAGLPQHFNYFYADEAAWPRPLDETIRRFAIIVRAPGEQFCYANLGFALIGHTISRVSRKPLAEFMRDEVFRPLGLNGTVFDPDPGRLENLAVKYDRKGNIAPFTWCDTPAAGHGYASVHDLIRFGMFHLKDHLKGQRPILDDTIIDRMQTDTNSAIPPESYGLGWFVRETDRGLRAVWHEGGWTGASAMLKLLPADDVAVAVLMNVYDSEFVNQVTEETLRAMLPAYRSPDRVAASAQPPFQLPTGTYSGEIRTSEGAVPLILDNTEGGELHVHLGDPSSPARRVRDLREVAPPGEFMGVFPGPLGDNDAERYPHRVVLNVRLVGDELKGTASALADDQRMHFLLPHRVSLKRSQAP
jgi:CubicO group peptidase (beta-lactamase class C family)